MDTTRSLPRALASQDDAEEPVEVGARRVREVADLGGREVAIGSDAAPGLQFAAIAAMHSPVALERDPAYRLVSREAIIN